MQTHASGFFGKRSDTFFLFIREKSDTFVWFLREKVRHILQVTNEPKVRYMLVVCKVPKSAPFFFFSKGRKVRHIFQVTQRPKVRHILLVSNGLKVYGALNKQRRIMLMSQMW